MQEFLPPELFLPEVLLGLDVAIFCALNVLIIVGITVARRLKRLYAARSEWAAELAEFSARADAAEAGLERLRTALLAEAERRRPQRRPPALEAAVEEPEPTPEPVEAAPPPTPPAAQAVRRSPKRPASSILSMQ